MDLHHPLFQSLALPLGLSFIAAGAIRALGGPGAGARWAAVAVALALLASQAWSLGWHLPPVAWTQKAPLACAAAAALGVLLEAARTDRRTQWVAASLLWGVLLIWLDRPPLLPGLGSWAIGALLIGAVLHEQPTRAEAAAMLAVLSLGLALLALRSGSALLFELSLALAAAVAGATLWLWPLPRIALGAAAMVPAMLAWLVLAQGTGRLTGVRPGAVLMLGAGFATALLVRIARRRLRRGEGRAWSEALVVAVVAALFALAALVFSDASGPRAGRSLQPQQQQPSGLSDPYYTPKW